MKRGVHHLGNMFKMRRKSKSVKYLDKLVLIIAFIYPWVELPQLIEIYKNKAAENVSLFTWSFFVIFNIPWLIYGIVHRQKPIIVLYALWIVIESIIVLGILIYG